MPEKCALSHGSSPHVEKVCTVTQIRLGEGGGDTIGAGGGGGRRRTENRDHTLVIQGYRQLGFGVPYFNTFCLKEPL